MVKEINDKSEMCCLKLCNFKCVLKEGQECWNVMTPNEGYVSTCDEGLECVDRGKINGGPKCILVRRNKELIL